MVPPYPIFSDKFIAHKGVAKGSPIKAATTDGRAGKPESQSRRPTWLRSEINAPDLIGSKEKTATVVLLL